MAAMIAENSYLVPDEIKAKFSEANKFLITVTDLEDDMEEGGDDEIMDSIDSLKRNIDKKLNQINKNFISLKETLENDIIKTEELHSKY